MTGSGIVIEKLVKVYSRRGSQVEALKGIDLEVRSGEIFGLLGPNGAGKTTTVGVCTTRVRATSGRVTINGIDVRRLSNWQVRRLFGREGQPLAAAIRRGTEKLTLRNDSAAVGAAEAK